MACHTLGILARLYRAGWQSLCQDLHWATDFCPVLKTIRQPMHQKKTGLAAK